MRRFVSFLALGLAAVIGCRHTAGICDCDIPGGCCTHATPWVANDNGPHEVDYHAAPIAVESANNAYVPAPKIVEKTGGL